MSGKLWMFSDMLDDYDLWFAQKEFFTYRAGCEYYGLTEKVITKMAKEAGAVYKIDTKMVRVNRDIFESYLRDTYRRGEVENV
jgi:hypothetical protein